MSNSHKNHQAKPPAAKPAATEVKDQSSTKPVETETKDAAAAETDTKPAATESKEVDSATLPNEEVKVLPPAAPVVEKAKEPTVYPAPIPQDPFELPLAASATARLTIAELKDYIEKMSASTRMTPEVGGQTQAMLFHVLIQAINSSAEEFDMVFGLVMKLIRKNIDGVFNEINVHRYTPHVTLPSVQAAAMRYLVNALTALADPAPEARKIAKRQINIEQALGARQIKEDARQRVMAFFNF